MANRRQFIRNVSTIGALLPAHAGQAMASSYDYYKELNVSPIINACGNYTRFSGSLMAPEVLLAMQNAAKRFVRLDDLQNAIGARVASLAGAEAALVSAGAAAAISLGTAACVAGNDPDRIHRLPDTSGMKNEVIIQKSHRNNYDHAIRANGVTLVEVETMEQLEHAVGPKTAMLAFFNLREPFGNISARDFAVAARRLAIPSLIDAAADIPPASNFRRFIEAGYDLVCISSGKAIGGPQSAGFLMGRKDLIEAAKLNTSPHSDSIHRGMKVGKEEMVGALAALELYLKRDHAADWKEWKRRVAVIAGALNAIPGVTVETYVPPIASHMPHAKVLWDQSKIRLTVDAVAKALRENEPSIEVNPDSNTELILAVWTLLPGEEKIVANRLRAILKGAAA